MSNGLSTPAQKERLLEAAIELLRTQGAAGLTVRNVAKLASCSTTGVYTYFGGKDGLVEAIYIEGFTSFDAAIGAADSLRQAGRAYRDWALANPTHYLVMFGKAVPSYSPGPDALTVATKAFDRLVELVRHERPDASADGASANRTARAGAYHVWATVHGYVMLELLDMSPPDLPSPNELYSDALQTVS